MSTKQKILIVDDKPENLFSLKQVLADTKAEIIEALNANQALIASLNHEFALAILDVQMPDMNGYELAEYLRSERTTETLPIIFVSAVYSSDYHVFKGYEFGGVDFLVKPFDARILLSKVAVFLELDRQKKELKEAKECAEKQFLKLKASENRFESLVLTIPDIVYRIDTKGKFTFVNDAVKKLGYLPEELIGNHFSTIIFPADVKDVSLESAVKKYQKNPDTSKPLKLFDERRIGSRKTTGLEIRLISKKGTNPVSGRIEQVSTETVIVEVNSAGLYSEQGQGDNKVKIRLGTVGVIRDITNRKKLEESLIKSNEELELRVAARTSELTQKNKALIKEIQKRIKAEKITQEAKKEWEEIFEAIGHMAVVLDKKNKIIAVNRAAIKRIGCSKQELLGKKCHTVFHNSKDIPVNCPVSYYKKTGNYIPIEMEMEIFDRSYICSITPVLDESGELEKLIHIWTDITKRKVLQKELLQAHKMEAIGTLAGGIAHDFNNILSAIIGFSELALQNTEKGSLMEEDIKEIFNCGLRAKELVRQILTFARQSEEAFSEINVDYIVKEVVKFIRSTIPSSIEIRTNISSKAMIFANATQIHQVIMNLCTNASQAMQNKGILELSLKDIQIDKQDSTYLTTDVTTNLTMIKPGEYIELKVSDTGTGIDPEIKDKIFEPYFTTKETGEGTGMGLAVVQGIIQNLGGFIDIQSNPGHGSTFTILIPAISENIIKQENMEDSFATYGHETILFVDDEIPITKVGKRILESAGYKVVTTNDPEEALSIFKKQPQDFDLLITDMTMPGMTGAELIESMLEIRPDLPVILSTGYNQNEIINITIKTKLDAFIHKPIEKKFMIRTIREVIDKYRSSRMHQ